MRIKLWKPIVNCGFCGGDTPIFWDNNFSSFQGFRSEEDCIEWIDKNQENFTQRELGGCVCPSDFEVENPTFLDSDGIPILAFDDDVYNIILKDMNELKSKYEITNYELTNRNASSVIRLILHGKSKDEAIDEVMSCIRQTLEDYDGLYDDEEDDYDPSEMEWYEILYYLEEKEPDNWFCIINDIDWSGVHCEDEIDKKIDEWYDLNKIKRCKN